MKILICGLPGAGKTHLAERLVKHLDNCAWYNADVIRGAANDWDFSPIGRVRQANRMRTFADFEVSNGRWVVCDFVAPTNETRKQFEPDVTIWIDTINEGRFEDTNKMFEKPDSVNYHIKTHLTDGGIAGLANEIKAKFIKEAAMGID
jgi:adenylylsulfate kinase